MVVLGIDAHKRSHTVVAVDEAGRKLGERTIATTTVDHLSLLTWAEQFGGDRLWAIGGESSSVWATGLWATKDVWVIMAVRRSRGQESVHGVVEFVRVRS